MPLLASDDVGSLLRLAIDHARDVIWVVALALAGFAWLAKRIRTWEGAAARPEARSRRAPTVPASAPPAPAAGPTAANVPTAYRSAAAYAPVAPQPVGPPPVRPRATARGGAPLPPIPDPMRLPVIPAFTKAAEVRGPGRALVAAFANGPSARTAVVLAEILAPPVALR